MLANLQRSLPFTLALAIIVYLVLLLIPDLALSASVLVTIGVVLGGVLVPVLVEVKGASIASTGSPAAAKTNYDGETATLYVGNLPYRANEDAVRELFQKFGVVVNVRLMKDRQTGRRRGFGFVELSDDNEANTAISEMHETDIEGRKLVVNEARPREDSQR